MSIMIFSQRKDVRPWLKALQDARPDLDVRVYPDKRDNSEVTFALAWNHPMGAFRDFPNIKCIASMGAGADHVLKDPELPQDAVVTRIVDENLTHDMGTFTLALALSHLRGLTGYKVHERSHVWWPQRYKRPADVTVGVMGLGVLGAHVAQTLRLNGFTVNGWATAARPLDGVRTFAGAEALPDFLAQADILICLLPLTPSTANILNKETFAKLPQGAYVINVARGEHLVDEDLVEMLDNGHLAGASLDVFRQEPLPAAHPFWSHPRIDITPHIASTTEPASVVGQILANYDRLQRNEALHHVVSRQKGY
ncbi:glyoxylate/hydroxypyruvate reductase A [Pontibacter sp. E15-1]|uniref:2-hydroxyacid dehydrogenase n=1 Tax=Pontibacter sp. E15-1 TaxID=2919918 RepID=UPI001F4FFAB0|nr:glyoxylate/hydroxypyruvate reductase A [Pontibacter sp. E15-1]MCJ8163404.1 glyoxylate/hydroxypyruvate reductase A [Pontibacter sp. E15-1]